MSRIVIDGRWIKQSGIGRYIEEMLKEILLFDRTNQYILLVRSIDLPSLNFHAENLKYEIADMRWFSVQEQIGLLKLLNKLQPDLVHFTNFSHPIFYSKPFVINVHDLTPSDFPYFNKDRSSYLKHKIERLVMQFMVRQAIKNSKRVFALSNYVRNQIVTRFKIKLAKIIVTKLAGNQFYAPKADFNLLKFNIKKTYLLYVGNGYPYKNIGNLILAFQELLNQYNFDFQLVIVGKEDFFQRLIKEQVENLNLSERVLFTGYVDDSELAGLYKNAKLYVFPSLSEGFGLPPLEAMSYGVPVVSSNASCLPEILGNAVEYFDPQHSEKMAEKIAAVINNEAICAELVKKGYEQLEKYKWSETARLTVQTYNSVLSESNDKSYSGGASV